MNADERSKKVVSRITVWFPERQYGFLAAGGIGDEQNTSGYFLHANEIRTGIPAKGATVRFEVVVRKKGSAAINAEVFPTRFAMEEADALVAAATALAALVGVSK